MMLLAVCISFFAVVCCKVRFKFFSVLRSAQNSDSASGWLLISIAIFIK